jgi:hypothetical protein
VPEIWLPFTVPVRVSPPLVVMVNVQPVCVAIAVSWSVVTLPPHLLSSEISVRLHVPVMSGQVPGLVLLLPPLQDA